MGFVIVIVAFAIGLIFGCGYLIATVIKLFL